jgi:hypothetical protein
MNDNDTARADGCTNARQREVELRRIEALCRKFIEDNKIGSLETIYQCDWVIENAYEFIASVAEIVGYYNDPDEEAASTRRAGEKGEGGNG